MKKLLLFVMFLLCSSLQAASLPTVGGSSGTWGTELNTWLDVGHDVNGYTDDSDVNITGGSITGITDLAVADGGTGASTAAGARTTLSAEREHWINLQDYTSYKSGDDWTPAIEQAATDAGIIQGTAVAENERKWLYIPAGTYQMDSNVAFDNIARICGDGYSSRLYPTGDFNCLEFVGTTPLANAVRYIVLRDFSIEPNNACATGTGIKISQYHKVYLENIFVRYMDANGFEITRPTGGDGSWITMVHCDAQQCGTGFNFTGGNGAPVDVGMFNCKAANNTVAGIEVGGDGITISGCTFEGNPIDFWGKGLHSGVIHGTHFEGIEGTTTRHLLLQECEALDIAGCNFYTDSATFSPIRLESDAGIICKAIGFRYNHFYGFQNTSGNGTWIFDVNSGDEIEIAPQYYHSIGDSDRLVGVTDNNDVRWYDPNDDMYHNTAVRYARITAQAFHDSNNNPTADVNYGRYPITSGSVLTCDASSFLPDKSTVTGLTWYIYDNSADVNVSACNLVVYNPSDTASDVMGNIENTNGTGHISESDNTISNSKIHKSEYGYFLTFDPNEVNEPEIYLKGVEITYKE